MHTQDHHCFNTPLRDWEQKSVCELQTWISKFSPHIKHCYHQEQSRIKHQTHDIRKWTVKLTPTNKKKLTNLSTKVRKIQSSLKTFFSSNASESVAHTESGTQNSLKNRPTRTNTPGTTKPSKTNAPHKYVQTMLKIRRANTRGRPQDTHAITNKQALTGRKNPYRHITKEKHKHATIIQTNNTGTILSKLVKKFERWKAADKKPSKENPRIVPT